MVGSFSIYLPIQEKIYRRYFDQWVNDPDPEPKPYVSLPTFPSTESFSKALTGVDPPLIQLHDGHARSQHGDLPPCVLRGAHVG